MSTFTAGFLVVAFVGAGLSAAYWQLRRAAAEESTRDRLIREARERTTVWDAAAEKWVDIPPGAVPGPGQMTVREITEADPLELLYRAPAYDAALDAGCDRLWDAVRDEQTKPSDSARERLKNRITSDPRYASTFRRIADDHECAPDLADFADRLIKEIGDDQTKGDPTP